MKQKIIDFLLRHADPSIVLRVKDEVLNCISEHEKQTLLNKIALQKNVQTIIQAQKPDGWIGNHFHGMSKKFNAGMFDNQEVGLRFLAEKGFPPENEYIFKAVNSFLLKDPLAYEVYRIKQPDPPGTDYTTTAFGIYFIRCSLIVRAGHEFMFPKNDYIDVTHDVTFSFNTFTGVHKYSDISEVLDTSRKKLCFKPFVQWPCVYDLRVLAHSQGWRSNENIETLSNSINHLFSLPQSGEDVYTYRKGQFYSPCGAFINMPIINSINNDEITSGWFDIMELFARCGVVGNVIALQNEYESLLTLIDDNPDLNINFNLHKNETSWGPYGGIALETDWKSEIRKKCDLLFRILLIIHYTECV